MKILLIVLAVISVVVIVGLIILSHPAFGRRMSKERKARIEKTEIIGIDDKEYDL